MGRRIGALLIGVLVFVLASGASAQASALNAGPLRQKPDRGDALGAAVQALVAITSPDGATSTTAIPADFRAVMGYSPALAWDDDRSVLVKPAGGCSSPFGATRYGFATACRQHDLGYDLLRYADRLGEPLGADARRRVDSAFSANLHRRCHTAACSAAADGYAAAVTLNTARQRFSTPRVETPWHWGIAAALGALVALLLGAGPRGRTAPPS